jgi:hypothetical protein
VPLTGPASVCRLGVSGLAALLDDPRTGARERFTLRFPHGWVVPVVLSIQQQDEALALLHAELDRIGVAA